MSDLMQDTLIMTLLGFAIGDMAYKLASIFLKRKDKHD